MPLFILSLGKCEAVENLPYMIWRPELMVHILHKVLQLGHIVVKGEGKMTDI